MEVATRHPSSQREMPRHSANLYQLASFAGWFEDGTHRKHSIRNKLAVREVWAALQVAGVEEGDITYSVCVSGGVLISGDTLESWPDVAATYPVRHGERFAVVDHLGRTRKVRIIKR